MSGQKRMVCSSYLLLLMWHGQHGMGCAEHQSLLQDVTGIPGFIKQIPAFTWLGTEGGSEPAQALKI